MNKKNIAIAAIVLILSACALPPSSNTEQTFVSEKELQVVSLTREGLNYYSRSRYIDAEFKFRKALELNPSAKKISYNLALALMHQSNFQEATEILEELCKQEPNSTQNIAALAQISLAQFKYQEAIEYYLKALEIALKWREFENAANFSRSIAVTYFTIGNETAAIEYSKIASNLDNEANELCRHSKLLTATGTPNIAIKDLISYINETDNMKNVCILQGLALAELESNNLAEAKRFSEIGANLKRADQKDITTFNLISEFVANKQQKESTTTTDSNTVNKEDTEDEQNTVAIDKSILSSGATLYWPLNFLSFLSEKLKSAPDE